MESKTLTIYKFNCERCGKKSEYLKIKQKRENADLAEQVKLSVVRWGLMGA